MANKLLLHVSLVYSPQPRTVHEVNLEIIPPCSVLQALKQSGLLTKCPEIDNPGILLGIWGRRAEWSDLLRDQDRIEVYRPLRVDPKIARRERFVKQGARTAGLFQKRRLGAKAGY
ncbi:MAG: RnfH family protein [Comamonadaceae bacterium]|nr:RnfH family protein [Comamonadaceae bacterium]